MFFQREGRQYRDYLRSRPGGYWATWTPALQQIEPGTIGRFDKDARFHAANQATLAARGITATISNDTPITDQFFCDARDWGLSGGLKGKLPVAGHPPAVVTGDGKVTIKTESRNAWLLQIRNATKAYIENDVDVFEKIRQILLNGAEGHEKWRVDNYVVKERVRASEGFAVISRERGREVTFQLGAGVTALGENELASASLDAAARSHGTSLMLFRFDNKQPGYQVPTPIFGAPIGIRREHWTKLLLLQRRDYELIDAAGESWPLGNWRPANLDHLPAEQRYYQEGAPGTLTREEIEAMPLWDLFGPIDHIDDDPYKPLRILRRGFDLLVSEISQIRQRRGQREHAPTERA